MTEAKEARERNEKGQFDKNNQFARKHGIHSSLPKIPGRRRMKSEENHMRRELEKSVGTRTIQKTILIDQIVETQGLCAQIEVFCRQYGIIDQKSAGKGSVNLHPVFGYYISFRNLQRLALRTLGLSKRRSEEVLTPFEIISQEQKGEENGKNKND